MKIPAWWNRRINYAIITITTPVFVAAQHGPVLNTIVSMAMATAVTTLAIGLWQTRTYAIGVNDLGHRGYTCSVCKHAEMLPDNTGTLAIIRRANRHIRDNHHGRKATS